MRMRAFSLVEVMVVVTIIAIVAAIAVPQLLPEVHKARAVGATEIVAATLARARAEAMMGKRCVRVYVDSTNNRRVVVERLNTFDCDTTPATFPPGFNNLGLDGTNKVWAPITTVVIDPGTSVALTVAPSDTAACSTPNGSAAGTPPGFNCSFLIFRPNGRVWTTNVDPDDDAVFNVTHNALGAAGGRNILVNSNGNICVYGVGQALLPGAGAGDFVCPP